MVLVVYAVVAVVVVAVVVIDLCSYIAQRYHPRKLSHHRWFAGYRFDDCLTFQSMSTSCTNKS